MLDGGQLYCGMNYGYSFRFVEIYIADKCVCKLTVSFNYITDIYLRIDCVPMYRNMKFKRPNFLQLNSRLFRVEKRIK